MTLKSSVWGNGHAGRRLHPNEPAGQAEAATLAQSAGQRPPLCSVRVLQVGSWPLSRVHDTLRGLEREGYLLSAALEDGNGGMELWLLKEEPQAA